ncbi:MAG: TGS domain-containing protein [Candidatus Diapherotrites archaeon]|jgi:uncharacterized protein|uniref:TGS domain-containing protein n=1 Tax=Candidatus Iainarchaeum sp. TaxID=3101447 RepID=A0A8T5GFQ3_9ARCH|nr:TGS domain-containing protein [Candidatus Diapherotrites archaeon]MBT7241031.1 TGS domain-containing protein [Candidatus Diapherotrites archaeon]
MPTNVPIEFQEAEAKFDAASTDEERLAALIEMKSNAPSHKGAEKLRSEINKKIATLKSKVERLKTSSTKKGSAPTMYVKKDGIGQIVIMGMPNTGKSWLLNKLVGKVLAEEADYEFATFEPVPGMAPYEGGSLQMVELPAIVEGSSKGRVQGKEIISLARNADSIIILGKKEQRDIVANELKESKIFLNKSRPPIEVKVSTFRGIQISGKEHLGFSEEKLIEYLKNTGFANATVIITGKIETIEDVIEALDNSIVYKKALFLDARNVTDALLPELKDHIFTTLNKVLVYTKKPGKDVEMVDPMALVKGATLEDLAKHLHKDFAKKLKFAKVWGSTKFPGQRVGPDFELQNKDVVEINI